MQKMGRGDAWLDTGSFVRTLPERQGLQTGSPDEIASTAAVLRLSEGRGRSPCALVISVTKLSRPAAPDVSYPGWWMSLSRPDGIERLILLAGVSCVGKTTFLKRLRDGDISLLPEGLAINPGESTFCNAIDVVPPRADEFGRTVVLHYDLFRPLTFYGSEAFEADPALAIVRHAREVSVMTLWEEPSILLQRAQARKRRLWRKLLRGAGPKSLSERCRAFWGARLRRKTMHPLFDDPRRLWQIYATWFDFCSRLPVTNHWTGSLLAGRGFSRLADHSLRAPLWSADDASPDAPEHDDDARKRSYAQ